MEVTCLFKDHPVTGGRCLKNREIGVLRKLKDLSAADIVRKEVEFAVSVTQEIYFITDPHWLDVIASSLGLGNLHHGTVCKSKEPYG